MHPNSQPNKLLLQPQEQEVKITSSPEAAKKKDHDKANLSDTGVAIGEGQANPEAEDSFEKFYSKELDLDEDEVPIILHELNDSALYFISREQYERALSLLQKAQGILEQLHFERTPKDRFIVLVTLHNMALCYQKLSALEECALCLEGCLININTSFLLPKFNNDPFKKLKKLKYECKIHMQICALLSQLHRHQEAMKHSYQAVQISHFLMKDLQSLTSFFNKKAQVAKKDEPLVQEVNVDGGNFDPSFLIQDDQSSMLERTSIRMLPIIDNICGRMIKESDPNISDASMNSKQNRRKQMYNLVEDEASRQRVDMRTLLGYLNQNEWLYLLNIGNIMQIAPLTIQDLYASSSLEVELQRDSILEKVSFLSVSYFCVSTEIRFIVQLKEEPNADPIQKRKESEFWHGKALELSCTFLPSESPLVSHIMTSYQKHHSPSNQVIPENEQAEQGIKIIRPMAGIDSCKYSPMIRDDIQSQIEVSPLNLSPTNYDLKKGRVMQAMTQSNYQNTGHPSPKDLQTEASTNFINQQVKSSGLTATSSQNLVSAKAKQYDHDTHNQSVAEKVRQRLTDDNGTKQKLVAHTNRMHPSRMNHQATDTFGEDISKTVGNIAETSVDQIIESQLVESDEEDQSIIKENSVHSSIKNGKRPKSSTGVRDMQANWNSSAHGTVEKMLSHLRENKKNGRASECSPPSMEIDSKKYHSSMNTGGNITESLTPVRKPGSQNKKKRNEVNQEANVSTCSDNMVRHNQSVNTLNRPRNQSTTLHGQIKKKSKGKLNQRMTTDSFMDKAKNQVLNENSSKSFDLLEARHQSAGKQRQRQSRSKDRQTAVQQTTQEMEDLKRQFILKQQLLDLQGKAGRRKSQGGQVNNSQKKRSVTPGLGNQSLYNTSVQQTIPQQPSMIVANHSFQNSNKKLNTHQLVKKFLKDRQTGYSSFTNKSNLTSMLDNYQTAPTMTSQKKVQPQVPKKKPYNEPFPRSATPNVMEDGQDPFMMAGQKHMKNSVIELDTKKAFAHLQDILNKEGDLVKKARKKSTPKGAQSWM